MYGNGAVAAGSSKLKPVAPLNFYPMMQDTDPESHTFLESSRKIRCAMLTPTLADMFHAVLH